MDKLISFPTPRAFQEEAPSSADDPVLCQVEMPLRAVFYPLGFAFEITTNSQAILDAATESWGHWRPCQSEPALRLRMGVTDRNSRSCPPAPVVRAQQHLLSMVADADHQAFCDLKAGFAFAWLTQGALRHPSYVRYHFLEAVALVLISTSYATAVHAACVSRHGRGMLFCGPSGAGKSTLAYACARHGWTFTSDDASYLKPHARELRVIGNSHQLRFRPSARDLFPELDGRDITPRAEGKPSIEVPTSELPGIVTAEEALVHTVILLNRQPTENTELLSLPSEAARQYFQQPLPLTDEIRELHAQALKNLETTKVYELRYQDLQQAVACLDLLVDEVPRPSGTVRNWTGAPGSPKRTWAEDDIFE